MKELLSRLSEVGEKAKYLENTSAELLKENRQLKLRVTELEQKLNDQNTSLNELNEQYEIIKLAKSVGSGSDDNGKSEEIKRKINEYIREIDQCLKLIGG